MIKNKRKSNIFKKLFARHNKAIVTVDSLLAQDDVDVTINMLLEDRHNIKSLMIIYVNNDDTCGTINTDDINNSDWVWWAERIKNDIFNREDY